jgi:MFS family permease
MTVSSRSSLRRLAVARLISVTGGAAAYTALMATIFERTGGSAAWLSATLLLTFGVNGFLGPLGAYVGDVLDRRKVLLVCDLAAAAFFLAMALPDTPGVLLAFAFGSALWEAPYLAASRAAIPNLVDREEDIPWANSWVGMGVNAGITIGPVIGGLLYASVGASWVFVANALTFLVSFALIWSVRRPFSVDRSHAEEHRGVVAGFRFILRDRLLRRITLAWSVMVLGLGMSMVADLPLSELFDGGPFGFGLIIACWGGGSVIGSFLGRRLNERTERLWVVAGTGVIALTSFGIGLSPVFWPVLVLILAMGVGDGLSLVADQGIRQRRTPDVVRSRVMAASDAVWQITVAVGFVLATPVLGLVGAQGLYVVGGVTSGIAVVMLLPVLRERTEPPAERLQPDEAAEQIVNA